MKEHLIRYKILYFYLFSFAIVIPASLLMAQSVPESPELSPSFLPYLAFSTLGGLSPLLSLSLLERLSGKAISVGTVYRQIRPLGPGKAWYIPAILALPALTLLGNRIAYQAGALDNFQVLAEGPAGLGWAVLPAMLIHFCAALITSPLFEEPCWRGFALVELQRRWGGVVGSLVVGGLWWLWHQPLNMANGLQPSLVGFVSMVAFSFMIDSLFTLSGKNVFTAMLAHQSSGTMFIYIASSQGNLYSTTLVVAFVVVLRLLEQGRAAKAQPALAGT